jgi:hypothetical protein
MLSGSNNRFLVNILCSMEKGHHGKHHDGLFVKKEEKKVRNDISGRLLLLRVVHYEYQDHDKFLEA